MIDIQFVRDNPELVLEKSKQKGYDVDVRRLLELDEKRRDALRKVEEFRRNINEHTKEFKNKPPTEAQRVAVREIKEVLASEEKFLEGIEEEYWPLLKQVPNMPLEDVPVGKSEDENVIVKQVGQIPEFEFEPKNHAQIAENKGWLDKERAAKVAGSRFAYLKGDLVQLHYAMMNYAMSVVTNEATLEEITQSAGLAGVSTRPFTLVMPPLMIKTDVYDAMDRLEPRDDRYKIEGEELWLQGSAEHVLGSMHMDELLEENQLPIRYVGYATSFRKEAGTYGKDMEGIFRLHQFEKLEMESLTTAEDSLDEHLFHIAIQEYLMQQLGLPYQLLMKCTADIGKPNARGVDIEVWLPGQNKFRETHTADYMTDYQSRRLRTRVRQNEGYTELVHTNDATVLSQRPLIAILENYQTAEGDVVIPDVLRPFMGGRERI